MMAENNTFTSFIVDITKDAEELYANFNAYWNEQNIAQEERTRRSVNFKKSVHELTKKFMEQEYQLLVEHRVEDARHTLSDWWDKCFTSNDERMQFLPFQSYDFSEELLAIHKQEKLNVIKYYNENVEIINLVNKQKEMFEVVKSIENRSLNADRLFKNRGAQLLKEEQDRKLVTKELPKLETKTLKEMAKYKNLHGMPFLIFGETFDAILEHQKHMYKENKLRVKEARENAKEMLRLKPHANKSCNDMPPKQGKETELPTPSLSTSKLHIATTYIATTSTGSKMSVRVKRKMSDFHTLSDIDGNTKIPKHARRRLVEPQECINQPTSTSNIPQPTNHCFLNERKGSTKAVQD